MDAWLAERRRRWEAGKTRCHELAPPPPPPPPPRPAGGAEVGDTVGAALLSERNAFEGGADDHPAEEGAAVVPGTAAKCDGRAGASVGGAPGGKGGADGEERGGGLLPWNWEREAGRGAGFDDFFETFAGGGVGDWDENGDAEVAEHPSTGGTAS